jgi:hypothetical protein
MPMSTRIIQIFEVTNAAQYPLRAPIMSSTAIFQLFEVTNAAQ